MEGGSWNGSVGFLGSGAVEWTELGCRVARGSRLDSEGYWMDLCGREVRLGRVYLRWTNGRPYCYSFLRAALYAQGPKRLSTLPGEVFD